MPEESLDRAQEVAAATVEQLRQTLLELNAISSNGEDAQELSSEIRSTAFEIYSFSIGQDPDKDFIGRSIVDFRARHQVHLRRNTRQCS